MTALSRRERLVFGLGGSVYAVKEAAYAIFVLLFYTQVLGLNGSMTGLVMALAILWDAVTDPMVGSWSDRLQSRWGRRHPFMVAGAFPLGIGFVALFAPPQSVIEDTNLLAGWLLFWSLWIRTAVTLFAIPHLAMVAELTNDYHERSDLLGSRLGFLFLTTVCLPAFGLAFLFPEQNGVDGRFVISNYPAYGWLSAVVAWVTAVIVIVGTRHHIPNIRVSADRVPTSLGLAGMARDFLSLLRNRNFRNILIYDIVASASYGAMITLNILTGTYYWELSTTQMSILLAGPSLIAVPLAIASIKPLGRMMSKHTQLQWALGLMLLNSGWVFPLRMWDIIPANGHPLVFGLLLLHMMIFMYLFMIRVVSAFSIIADVTDEHELEHGVRQEASFFSAMAFTSKFAAAAGPLFGGVALDLIGLQEGVAPGAVPPATLDGLAIAMTVGTVPLLGLACSFSMRIYMSEQKLRDIHIGLAAKKREREARLADPTAASTNPTGP
jgi:GPH family glycoside/pentoside/hexuronide:cation symporter